MKYLFYSLGFSAILILSVGCALGPKPPQVTGMVQAPIDFNDVGLYLPQCKPAHYETIAKLDASKLGNFSSYSFNLNWLEKLRKQTAELGANGLLMSPISLPIAPLKGPGPTSGPAFLVEAIYAPSVENSYSDKTPDCARCASNLEDLLSAANTNGLKISGVPHKRTRHIKCSGEPRHIGIYP